MKSSNSAAPAEGASPALPTAADWDAITANADPDPADLDRSAEDAKWAGAQAFTGETTPAQARALQGARRVGQRGPQVAPVKKQISFRIRPAVLEAWRATGPGWMGRMEEHLAQAPFVKLGPAPIVGLPMSTTPGAAIRTRHILEQAERHRALLDQQAEDEANQA